MSCSSISSSIFDGDDLTATGSLDPEKPKSANFSKTMSTKLIWYEYHLFLHALSLSRTLKYAPQLGIMIFFLYTYLFTEVPNNKVSFDERMS